MRNLTVNDNGKQVMTICLFCHKTEVSIDNWNRRCGECREKQRIKDISEKQQIDMGVGKRTPAAVMTLENGQKVFVDKFGREVDNPGYDLHNDPRGWNHTGTTGKKRSIIK